MSDWYWETVKTCFVTRHTGDLDIAVQASWNPGRGSSENPDQEPNRVMLVHEKLSFRTLLFSTVVYRCSSKESYTLEGALSLDRNPMLPYGEEI